MKNRLLADCVLTTFQPDRNVEDVIPTYLNSGFQAGTYSPHSSQRLSQSADRVWITHRFSVISARLVRLSFILLSARRSNFAHLPARHSARYIRTVPLPFLVRVICAICGFSL